MAERRRRAYGEGAIYRLNDGRWQGSVELGWIDGARRRRTVTRKSKSDVAREMRRLVTEAESGRLRYGNPPTLEQWMATYLSDVAATRVRPGTLHSYEQFARLYINPHLGSLPLDRIGPQHVTAFYRQLSQALAPSSVRRVHAVLRRALTVAVRWGLIQTNPAQLVDPPSVQRTVIQPYSVEEAEAFLAVAAQDRLEVRWVMALTLGPRQGEVLGLGWQHIDFEKQLIMVERARPATPAERQPVTGQDQD